MEVAVYERGGNLAAVYDAHLGNLDLPTFEIAVMDEELSTDFVTRMGHRISTEPARRSVLRHIRFEVCQAIWIDGGVSTSLITDKPELLHEDMPRVLWLAPHLRKGQK